MCTALFDSAAAPVAQAEPAQGVASLRFGGLQRACVASAGASPMPACASRNGGHLVMTQSVFSDLQLRRELASVTAGAGEDEHEV